MKSIIEELYYGNICPDVAYGKRSDEAKELTNYILAHYENLSSTLTDKQKEIFEKFNDCTAELTCMNERDIFTYAFRLGARIAIEMLMPEFDFSGTC